MIKRFFIITFIFLFILGVGLSFADTIYTYDDRSPFIDYSNRSLTVTSIGYYGTASRLARGYNCMFEFYGNSLSIYAVKYTNSGRARVYIDGDPVGYTVSGVTSSYTPVLAFSTDSLSDGKHYCSIEAWDSTVTNPSGTSVTAYFFLDYIELDHSLDIESIYQGFYLVLLSLILMFLILFNLIQYVLWRLSKRD